MAVIDVGLEDIGSNIADTAEKLSGAPEVAFTEVFAQPRMLAKEAISASTLEELKRSGDAHSRRKADKQVDVVCFDLKLEDLHSIQHRNLAQKFFAVFANNRKLKGVLRIFGLPHEVERVLSNTMAMVVKSFHHFFVPPRVFCEAHANPNVFSGCANYAAHSLITKKRIK